MEGITHLILLISGLCILPVCVAQHQYSLVTTPKTWYEAQSYCREKCRDLATIDDMREMKTVLETVKGKYDDAVWIGLHKAETRTWHWSLADKDFYKEGERDYFLWGEETGYHCVAHQQGKLDTASCHNKYYSICFDGRNGQDQYILKLESLNWTDARDYCRTYHTDLASLRNDAEYLKIEKIDNGYRLWVGLFRDDWVWSDKTYSSLRYWHAQHNLYSEDLEECGVLLKSKSGRWGSRPCAETHPFLCNCPQQNWSIKVKIIPQDAALDLNEPAVQDAILEQMRQELSETLTDPFQLKWKKQPNGKVFNKET
ncbi:C-type mannose receptor 2-like isoform X2 [Dicentrarchus labrax]|uniref:C-type mannose receptor 2-like isoform X2 n=1 Tax=Dicentrarchus labrax TaxID=13489 RepID=UPI0021F61545|nr:C-type mannose receptor 2-like isoform X2 [Dicentrarchus labrax]